MNLGYSIEEICDLIPYEEVFKYDDDSAVINEVVTDSRIIYHSENTLFVGLQGDLFNGEDFFQQCYDKGVRNFMSSSTPKFQKGNWIVVDNTTSALQNLAKAHRSKFNIPIVGITGSAGKSTVKEWLFHFLKDSENVVRNPKSFNSQIGVPLSILELNKNHTIGLFEAGISQPNEMQHLESIIQPSIGILTNIGTAHLENFKDQDELKHEKNKLFKNCSELEKVSPFKINTDFENNESRLSFNIHGQIKEFTIPFIDIASVDNFTTCLSFLLKHSRLSISEIQGKSKNLSPLALRLSQKKGINNNLLIDDSYNSDITGFKIAMDLLKGIDSTKNKSIILSEFQASGKEDLLVNELNSIDLDQIFFVGQNLKGTHSKFAKSYWFATTEELLQSGEIHKIHNNVILIKGARHHNFEKITSALEYQSHDTILEVNLDILSSNFRNYKKRLHKDTQVICMLKAQAYGSGAVEIAKRLSKNGANYFGVAYADEGVELRENEIQEPILVMNAEKSAFNQITSNNLEPAIFSFKQLDEFIDHLIHIRVRDYPIHIKIDTGMKRLGFEPSEIQNLIAILKSQPEVKIKSCYSHLAGSDDAIHDGFTMDQIDRFQKATEQITQALGYPVSRHILNTSGIERFTEHQMDMVRLGIGLFAGPNNRKNQVSKLITRVSQIKTLESESSVGYNRTEKLPKGTKIAVIPVGYADGFSRKLSNGVGKVYINGQFAPVIGRVCMDMTMINITGIDTTEGAEVEIFGDHISIHEMAELMETIPYEILTSVSDRVARVYVSN